MIVMLEVPWKSVDPTHISSGGHRNNLTLRFCDHIKGSRWLQMRSSLQNCSFKGRYDRTWRYVVRINMEKDKIRRLIIVYTEKAGNNKLYLDHLDQCRTQFIAAPYCQQDPIC